MKKYIDSHLHFDTNLSTDITVAVNQLDNMLAEAEIEFGVALHLLCQPWSIDEVMEAVSKATRLKCMINVDPFDHNAKKSLQRGIEELGCVGLKLHPRLQNFNPSDKEVIDLVCFAGEIGIPTLIDAFPDGTALMTGFNPLNYATLASQAPNSKIIWAHFGGHKVIDFMMLAKRLPNVYVDLSYSLLYYRGSSVIQDIFYAIQSMRFNRVMYGSDYPDRSILQSLESSLEVFQGSGFSDESLNKIFYQNAKQFFDGCL